MPSQPFAWTARTTNLGAGARSWVMYSRKRAHRKEKRHSHLVLFDPMETPKLVCTCKGFASRRICAGTRTVLAGRAP